ncbi:MAG TPA: superoxide dismutase family protein [Gemmatimonadaceae bacterium]|nr:superoxide dismutase family protein [Gemmatimonadaceae bacterium]
MLNPLKTTVVACATAVLACSSPPPLQLPPSPSPSAPATRPATPTSFAMASATLHDASGRRVGTVTFADSYSGVMIRGTVSDLGLGTHAIHIHAIGKCEAPFTTAGGHFNPLTRQHGYLNPRGPHLGDLPNLTTPAAGSLTFEFLLPGVTLKGTNALLDGDGAAVVIHASKDDYLTDPAGNAGARAACGVITAR